MEGEGVDSYVLRLELLVDYFAIDLDELGEGHAQTLEVGAAAGFQDNT